MKPERCDVASLDLRAAPLLDDRAEGRWQVRPLQAARRAPLGAGGTLGGVTGSSRGDHGAIWPTRHRAATRLSAQERRGAGRTEPCCASTRSGRSFLLGRSPRWPPRSAARASPAPGGRGRPGRARHLRPHPDPALDPAQLPGDRPHAVPDGGHPPRAAAVLHRAQLRRSSLRPQHPLVDLPARQGESRRSTRSAPSATSTRSATSTSSTRPRRWRPMEEPPRVRVGGPDCTQPYDMALLNVSAMSFGSLSAERDRGPQPRRRGRWLRPRHR